ncbi:MAG: Cable pili-associated 22 kDa adhesin protein [Frankiales bacterium]|nr:Cable pili-associated 22 kDa adhesin protein [Frankiales bacterium]
MGMAPARLLRTPQLRVVRSAAALLLCSGVAATGVVALATPAHALAPPPDISSPAATVTSNDPSPLVTFTGAGLQYECAAAPASDPTPAYADCSSPWAVPALGPDGDYTLSVREKSLSDDGTPATVAYTLDTVAGLTVTPPTSPGNDPRPTWGISVDPSGAATCSLDAGPDVSCTTGFTPSADLTEGSHDLAVTATDPAGNTSPVSTTSYVLDTVAPAAPTVTGANGIGNDTSPTWTWANPEDVAALCTLTSPAGAGAEVACSSHTSYTASAATEGDYSLSVVLEDAAHNRSTAAVGPSYTLDTTPSAAAVFGTPPTSPSTSTSVTWTFTEPGASTMCALVGSTHGTVSTAPCSSPATFTLPGDDSWQLVVTEDDGHGNTVATTSAAYLLDTTGPDAPDVSGPTGLANSATPHVTWMGELPSTAVCRWQRTVGSVVTDGTWVDCSARDFYPTLPGDGSYVFQAQLTDPLGNVGVVGTTSTPYLYDGTAPAPPALTTPSSPGNDTTPTVTFTPETPGGTATCTVYSGTSAPTSPTWTDCTSGSYTPALASDGTWTLAVRLSDAAGNTSAPTTFGYVLDTTAPTAVVISGPTGPSNNRTPTWSLVGDASDTITCQLLVGNPPSGGTAGGVSPCTTSYTADLTGLADGDYTLQVTAHDTAQNAAVTTWPYTLDTTAPTVPTVSGPTGAGNALAPSWTFPVQAGTTAQCRLVQGIAISAWSDCSSGRYTVASPSDGTYTVDVLVTDLAGNDAQIASSAPYTSDRTAPAAPAVAGPAGPGNTTAPTWTWTGEAGVTASCRLDRAGVVGSEVPCNSGSFSPALTGDASYVVVVQLTDAAGNVSPATTTSAYLLDTSAPAAPVVSGPTGTAQTTTATWSWTAEAGAASNCVLIRDGVPGAPAPCTSGTAVPLSSDGSYVLQVTVQDAAGNVSPAAQSAPYQLDTTAPAAPTVTTPSSPSAVRAPAFPFSAEPGAATQCRWRQGTTVVNDWSSCTTPYTADVSAMPDADYELDVRAIDAAGNTGAVGTSLAYRLDTTAPAAPVVAMPTGPSTGTSPTVSWTGEVGTSGSCVLVHDGVAAAAVSCSTPWQPTLVGDGSWDVSVKLTDSAGNQSGAGVAGPYVLDTTPPGAPVLTAPASPGRDTMPVWSATFTAGDTAECATSSGARVVADWAACTFPWTTDLRNQPDGTYTLTVRAVDEVGLTSAVVSATYTLDTTGPAAPVVTAPTSPSQTTGPVFGFTSEAGSSTRCTVTSGATVVSATAPCTSPVTVDLAGRADGAYTLAVDATDVAGNPGGTGSASYVLDRTAPAAPVATSTPASPSPSTSPSWGFTAEAGTTTTCTVTGASTGQVVSAPCTSPFAPTLSTDDTYTFTVTATDAAGNTGPALSETYVLDTTAPATPTLTPPSSPSQSTAPAWGVSTAEGTVQCQLTFGGTVLVDWTDCTSGFSTSLTGPDGTYTLTARTVDAAGNLSAVATSSYVLDRAAPVAATMLTPASPSKGLQPTWTVSDDEPGVTAVCTLNGPGGAVAAPVSCSAPPSGAPFGVDLTGLTDGSYTLTVQVSDAAGNKTSATSTAYVLDTTAPSAVVVTAPRTPAAARVVTWTLIGDTDSTLECAFQTDPASPPAFATCPGSANGQGSFTADLTSANDGTYVLIVRARDASGNLGPSVSSAYVLDTLAPAAPTGLRALTPSPSNAGSVTWSFAVEGGSTALCQLLSISGAVTAEQPCSSPLVTDLGQQPDGTYSLTVRAQDAAGNLGPLVTADYIVDRTAPGAPLITKTPGSPGPVVTPVWGVEVSEPGDLLECRLVGLPGSSWAPCAAPVTYDLAPATSGSYTLQARETDPAGNVSAPVSAPPYLLDSNAPVPPEVSPPLKSPGNSTSPVFRIAEGAGSKDIVGLTCSVTRFDGKPATASPCALGSNTVALVGMAPRSQGAVSLSVQGQDAAGNVSGTAMASYFFDSIPPAPAQIRPLAADVGTTPRVTWTFGEPSTALRSGSLTSGPLSAAGTSFRCQLTKGGVAPSDAASKSCRSPHTELLTQTGTWLLWVWAVDPAGNRATPVSSRYTFVSPVPAVTDLRTPASGPGTRPTWTFTVPPSYTAACLLSNAGEAVLAQASCSSGRFTADLSSQPHGLYFLTVQLINTRGDEGPFTRSTPYDYRASSVTPPTVVHHVGKPGTPSTGLPGVSTPPPVHPTQPPAGSGLVPAHQGTSGPVKRAVDRMLTVPTPGALITKEVPQAIGNTLAQVARKPTIPLVVLGVVIGFLLLQNRIDRRDPKLASAPVGAEPELDFGPVLHLGGGAPA